MLQYNGEDYGEFEDILDSNYTWYSESEVETFYEKDIESSGKDALLVKNGDPTAYEVWFHDFISENFKEVDWLYYYNEEVEEMFELTTGEALSFWLDDGLIWNTRRWN